MRQSTPGSLSSSELTRKCFGGAERLFVEIEIRN